MGDTLGLLTVSGREGQGRTTFRDNIAESTAAKLDVELSTLLERERKRSEETIRAHWDQFVALIDNLIERKKLEKEDVIEILGDPVTAKKKE